MTPAHPAKSPALARLTPELTRKLVKRYGSTAGVVEEFKRRGCYVAESDIYNKLWSESEE